MLTVDKYFQGRHTVFTVHFNLQMAQQAGQMDKTIKTEQCV